MLQPTMEQKAGSLSQRLGSYVVSLVVVSSCGGWRGGGEGQRGRGGGDWGGIRESSSVSLSDASLALSGGLLVCWWGCPNWCMYSAIKYHYLR